MSATKKARDAPGGLKRKSASAASTQVVQFVSSLIESGALVPGQRIIEADIGERTGVGRGSVREGLRLLAVDGVVSVDFNRGVVVKDYTIEEVLALHDVRGALEGLAAGLAARRVGSIRGAGGRIRALNRKIKGAVNAGDIPSFVPLNIQFHDLLVELSGNPFIAGQIAQAKTSYFRLQTKVLNQDEIARSQSEHDWIGAAVLAGRAEEAERAMRDHIRSSRDMILKAFGDR